MKTNLFISAIVAGAFFISSCRKMDHEDTTTSKVINVELKQNESYSYTIPQSGDADDVMEISQQARHAATSKLTANLFEYTPNENYTGSDEVHVNTVEGDHKGGNGGHNHGNCEGHGNETKTNYIFKINITGTSSSEHH